MSSEEVTLGFMGTEEIHGELGCKVMQEGGHFRWEEPQEPRRGDGSHPQKAASWRRGCWLEA